MELYVPPLRRSRYNVRRWQRTCHCLGYWFPHRWESKWCYGNTKEKTPDDYANRPTGKSK